MEIGHRKRKSKLPENNCPHCNKKQVGERTVDNIIVPIYMCGTIGEEQSLICKELVKWDEYKPKRPEES